MLLCAIWDNNINMECRMKVGWKKETQNLKI